MKRISYIFLCLLLSWGCAGMEAPLASPSESMAPPPMPTASRTPVLSPSPTSTETEETVVESFVLDGEEYRLEDFYGRFVISEHIPSEQWMKRLSLSLSDEELNMLMGNVVVIHEKFFRTYLSHRAPENTFASDPKNEKPNYIRIVETWSPCFEYRFVKTKSHAETASYKYIQNKIGVQDYYYHFVVYSPMIDGWGVDEIYCTIQDKDTLYMRTMGETFILKRVPDDYPDKPVELLQE